MRKNKEENSINLRIRELVTIYFAGNNSKFARFIGINESNVRNYIESTEPKYTFLSLCLRKFPQLSAEWLLLGKGDMLLPSGEHQEPAAVPHEPVGEKSAGKSGDKSSILVADEPQGYYPTSPTEQVLRQLVSALERTIKDKEEIISLLKKRQPK